MATFSLLLIASALSLLLLLRSAAAIDAPPQSHRRREVPTSSKSPQDRGKNHHNPSTNLAHLLPQILSQLGFHDLAAAAPSLSAAAAAAGPSTVFAPSDASLRSCVAGAGASCSVPELLREHVVAGLFTAEYLGKLAFGTKVETLSPGRCLTVTSSGGGDGNQTASSSSSKKVIFIGGVEITEPDLFNNGIVVVHGLRGFVAPLSPVSCDVERMSSLSFPYNPDHHDHDQDHHRHHHHHHHHHKNRDDDQDAMINQRLHFNLINPGFPPGHAIMRLMLKDAMLRLRGAGFGILALALRIKYPELVPLNNMTVFAINDAAIFSGLHSYVSNVRFHIVPNAYLTLADLEKLPLGTIMPTLAEGQSLVVTASGIGGLSFAPMRINYVRIRVPELIRNLNIVVHALFLPFPHIHTVAVDAARETLGGADHTRLASDRAEAGTACSFPESVDEAGVCAAHHDDLLTPVKPTVEVEDHGL